jgi:kynurenine formamidase
MGRAVYVKLLHLNPNSHILPVDMEKASGGRVRKDDVVIIDSPYVLEPFTNKTNTEEDKRLFICREAAEWFAEKQVKCVGFGDGVSIENNNEDVCAFHDVLMAQNIVFLEVLKNLRNSRRTYFYVLFAAADQRSGFSRCGHTPLKGSRNFQPRACASDRRRPLHHSDGL